MPKQLGDLSKGTRMHYVWRAVSRLGRATPEMVVQAVAQRASLDDADPNLKRNVYRDLQDLADTGDLSVEYFSPDGAKVEESGDLKNLRAEYFVTDEHSSILGGGLLLKAGGLLVPSKAVSWRITETSRGPVEGALSMHFESQMGRFLSLSVENEDYPFRLILARREPTDSLPSIDKWEARFGLRASLLLLSEKSLSRIDGEVRLGHAMIEGRKEMDGLYLRDLGSQNGTFWAPATANDIENLAKIALSDATVSQSINPLTAERQWQKVSSEGGKAALPAFLRAGQFTVLAGGW